MTTFYYHVTNPTRCLALSQYVAERNAALEKAREFGQKFATDGQAVTPMLRSDYGSFAGIKFEPPMPADSWTVPDKHGMQRPRSAMIGKKLTAEQKQAHAELVASWTPPVIECMSVYDLYKHLIDMDTDFLTSMSSFSCADGTVMVSISRQTECTDGVTEVLGSVYAAAEKAMEEVKA